MVRMLRYLAMAIVVTAPIAAARADSMDDFTVWLDAHPTLIREPVLRQLVLPVGCYDARTGLPLNCRASYESYFSPATDAPSLETWAGGHLHPSPANPEDPARPIGTLCSAIGGQSPCPPTDLEATAPRSFTGMTNGQRWSAVQTLPPVSGYITIRATYIAPPLYRCVDTQEWRCDPSDITHRIARGLIGVRVRVGGITAETENLQEFPADTDVYIRCGTNGCDHEGQVHDEHPHPFYGTAALVDSVRKLAQAYKTNHTEQGLRLRIMDMSLPWGGLMECNPNEDPWKPTLTQCNNKEEGRPGHCWHRVGGSVDIGRLFVIGDSGQQVWVDPTALALELEEIVRSKKRTLPLWRVPEAGSIHFQLLGGGEQ